MAIKILSSENITGSFEVSGKVGIGTAPTSRNLSVFRGTAGSVANFLHYTDASNFAGLYIGVSQSSQTVSLNASGSSGGNFEMQCGNATVLTLNNSSATLTGNLSVSGTGTFTGKVDSINGEGFRLKNAANSANEGGFTRSGYWEGNTNRDPGIFAETGLSLRFYTGGSGTPKMILSSTGNVGIGTGTNIYGDLHLQGGQQDIILTNTAADGVAGLTISRIIGQARGYSNNGAVMQSIDFITNSGAWYKGDIVFKTNNTDGTDTTVAATERMRIKADGSINIGERRAALPSNFGYSSSYKTLILGSSGTNYTTDAVTLSLGVDVSGNPSGSYNGNGREIIIRNEGAFISPNASNNGYNTILSWNSSGQPYFIQNVGIGTTSPGNKLTIASGTGGGSAPDSRTLLHIDKDGEAYISINSPAESFNGIRLNVAGTPKGIMELYDNTAQGKKLNIGTVDARDVVFATSNQPKMTLQASSGNVGIGTTSPQKALHVVGANPTIRVEANTTNWAALEIQSADTQSTYIFMRDSGGERARIQTTSSNDLQIYTGGGGVLGIAQNSSGNVGIGTTSPTTTLSIKGTSSNGINIIGVGTTATRVFAGLNSSNHGYISVTGSSGQGPSVINSAGGNSYISDGNVGIGLTGPETKLQVKGAVGMGAAIHDGNIAYSSSGFGNQDGGSLHINYSLSAATSSGDTITFTYAATVWKSWSLKYNFASTSGITQGVVGGYWNNSGGSSNHTEHNDLGVSVAVTHTGQGNTITFTFTSAGTHPMANFVYMQGGGDGQPRADRVTLTSST